MEQFMKYTKEQLDIMAQAEFNENDRCTNIEWITKNDSDDTWANASSPSWCWSIFNFRVKSTNQYVPYTKNDNIVGRIVKYNDMACKELITSQGNIGVTVGYSRTVIHYQDLFDNYQSVNKQGKPYKPAGKLLDKTKQQ